MNVLHAIKSFSCLPWLVIGKGPSFSQYEKVLAESDYNVFSISDVGAIVESEIVYFTDYEAYQRNCEKLILPPRTKVCLPWHPHINHKATHLTLLGLAAKDSHLNDLYLQQTLVAYNSTTAGRLPKNPHLPTVPVRLFSGVAAISILAAAGVKYIYSLGLDGGDQYAPEFDKKHLGANGRPTFDGQSEQIRRIVKKHKINYTPLS